MVKIGHFAAIGFTLIFGFSYMFSKIALTYVSPMGLVAYRYLFAFMALELLRRLHLVDIQFKRFNLKIMGLIVLFQPILYSVFSTYGLNLIASSEAIMMIALIPVFAGLISAIVLKEVPTFKQILFILISVGGVVYIQVSLQSVASSSRPLGFLLVLISVMSGAMYNVISRAASKSMRAIDITYGMMVAGVIVFNIVYLTELLRLGTPGLYIENLSELRLIFPVLYLGLLSTVAAFFLLNFALSKLPAHVVSIYANLVTVIGIFAGYVILNETLFTFHFVGSLLIIFGVYGTVISQKKSVTIKKVI